MKRELRTELQIACAIAHGLGKSLSAVKLCELILEKGLPSREERERMVAERVESERE